MTHKAVTYNRTAVPGLSSLMNLLWSEIYVAGFANWPLNAAKSAASLKGCFGSRREELKVSESFPPYPHNRKSASISNNSE